MIYVFSQLEMVLNCFVAIQVFFCGEQFDAQVVSGVCSYDLRCSVPGGRELDRRCRSGRRPTARSLGDLSHYILGRTLQKCQNVVHRPRIQQLHPLGRLIGVVGRQYYLLTR